MIPIHGTRRILRKADVWFIVATLAVAMVLNLMPVDRGWYWPDWVAMVLLFWSLHEPKRVGPAVAFLCGLLLDVVQGKVLGQSSAIYILLAVAGQALANRMLWYTLPYQTVYVFSLLLAALLSHSLLGLMLGLSWPRWSLFAASIGAILWPVISYALLWPQFQPLHKDNIRPL